MAVIEALSALTRPCDVVLHTDSQYVQKGISEWIHGWKERGWKTAAKEPVKNADLWQALDAGAGAAPGGMALGARPQRPCRQRARRPAGQPRLRVGDVIRCTNRLLNSTNAPDRPRHRNHRPEPASGDRVIEIGCVEMVNRRADRQQPACLHQPGARLGRGRAGGARPDHRIFERQAEVRRNYRRSCSTICPARKSSSITRRSTLASWTSNSAGWACRRFQKHVAGVIDTLVQAKSTVPRQAQFAGRAVRPLRHLEFAPGAARRAAGRRIAGRRLSGDDARPEQPDDRPARGRACGAGRGRRCRRLRWPR